MKNAPFKYLLYREMMMSGKNLINGFIGTVALIIVAILIQMSINFGNLSKLGDEFDELIRMLHLALLVLPVGVIAGVIDSVALTSINDVEAKWSRYRLSLPVPPVRLALAKYTYTLLLIVAGIAYSSVYILIMKLIGNNAVTVSNIKIVGIAFCVFIMFQILMQVLGMFYRSYDKAGITIVVVFFGTYTLAGVVAVSSMFINFEASVDFFRGIFSSLKDLTLSETIVKFSGALPVFVIATVILYIIGFFLTALLYKRRER